MDEKARNHFLGKKGHKKLNCAQTIVELFKDRFDFLSDETVKKFKKMGYGKAPEGQCGIVYAAKYIFEKQGRIDDSRLTEKYFIKIAGTTNCKELKKKKIPFCTECLVQTARFIQEKHNSV
ncbi:MAG: hypothetical protein HKP58_15145 [Desulfatitalea sp.]|nr:hypothetical protein [Desulfatitalea sp.]NNK01745.1 hypothetical protein [Desulfatitalea sp.]